MLIAFITNNKKSCFSTLRTSFSSQKFNRKPRFERSNSKSSFGNVPDLNLSFKKTIKIDPNVKTNLSELSFSSKTLTALTNKGFTELTPIQSQAYQHILNRDDIVARSRTGTGKTYAFGIPLIEMLVRSEIQTSSRTILPKIIILEPTRELAIQVAQELSYICKFHGLRVSAIFGGSSFSKQEEDFRNGLHIVVATPGRLLDHISRRTINLKDVQHVVLDEGDTMLEMGFQEDVESILMSIKVPSNMSSQIASRQLDRDEVENGGIVPSREVSKDVSISVDPSKKVQMLLFSATMPGWICKITEKLMKNSVFLDAVQDGETRLASSISHFCLLLPGEIDRFDAVASYAEDIILTKGGGGQTIIFTNTKEEADRLSSSRCFGHLKCQVLHGDISQVTRQRTIRQFREKELDVLVATDVAARGLDIAGVDLVVHTCPPRDVDSYVHRSGRTGRAGRFGNSVLFYSRAESHMLKILESKLLFSFERIGPPSLQEISTASAIYAVKKLGSMDEGIVKHFMPEAKLVMEKALSGTLWSSELDSEVVLKELQPSKKESIYEELIARCLISISQRQSLTSRSVLTGKEGFVTLKILGSFADGKAPQDAIGWNRFLKLFLTKMLKLERFEGVEQFDRHDVGKMVQAIDDNSQKTVLLVDVEHELGNNILSLSQQSNITKHVVVERCDKLPERTFWASRSGDEREYSRSSRSGGGEREYSRSNRSGGSGGGGDREFSRSSRSGGSGGGGDREFSRSSRSGGSGGDDRRKPPFRDQQFGRFPKKEYSPKSHY